MFTTSWRYTVTSLETIPAFRPNFQKFTFLDFPKTGGFPSLSYDEVVGGRYNLTRSFETIPSFNKSPSTLAKELETRLLNSSPMCHLQEERLQGVYQLFLFGTNQPNRMILVPNDSCSWPSKCKSAYEFEGPIRNSTLSLRPLERSCCKRKASTHQKQHIFPT